MKQLPYNTDIISERNALFAVIGALLILLVVLLWPLATIWALNTLFGLTIGYTFWNWLATWILVWTFQGALKVSRKRN